MKEYPIAGHSVRFPRQPYGAQMVFMQRLITSIQNQHNALLELPLAVGRRWPSFVVLWHGRAKPSMDAEDLDNAEEVSLDDLSLTQGSPGFTQAPPRDAREEDAIDAGCLPEDVELGGKAITAKVPRVYYATRTHSQMLSEMNSTASEISVQVANELKNTGYTPKMAILGSRKHYCINQGVRQSPARIDDACKDKCETKKGCEYYKGKEKSLAAAHRAPPVHDIEDLVKFGHKAKACPFFMSRDLHATAELVFCPYNYIIDPAIRSAMQIDLTGSVVIFDEAHNIEDAAREAGSIDITLEDVEAAITDTIKNMEHDTLGGQFRQLNGMLTRLKLWLQKFAMQHGVNSTDAKAAFEAICRPRGAHVPPEVRRSSGIVNLEGQQLQCVWSGGQIRTHLSQAGLDPASNSDTKECLQQAKKSMEDRNKDHSGKSDKSGTLALTFLESLMQTLTMVYGMVEQGPDANNGSDYRLVVTSWKEQQTRSARSRFVREDAMEGQPCVQLSLWCMNPACAFREIGDRARSVIVTSGTLSPMTSFASELGIPFPGPALTTPHVVPEDQVLPMVVSRSLKNQPLKATYEMVQNPVFQDAVIETLISIAEVVPDGMLVFLSSYGILNKLVSRWERTRALLALRKVKPLWTEPQGGSAEDLERSIQEYYAAIQEGLGGIFFAVCRGKVSEGINFADEHARAVVLVGIPNPAVKDAKVQQKRAYNDHKDNQKRGLISGSKWYTLQAHRAMNQALGRCIRHKQDYGAIILMDQRMLERTNQVNLSQWVRNRIANRHYHITQACQQLTMFFEHCVQKEAALKNLEVKDEKKDDKDESLLVKKEEAEVLDEKPLVKDEKFAFKQENETAEHDSAGLSTQALWAEPPKGKQRVTVAQAMPSHAATHSADVEVEPKLEDSDCHQYMDVLPKPEPCVHGCTQNATVKEEQHDNVQLVTPKPSVRERFQSRGSMRQSSLKNMFVASKQRPPATDSTEERAANKQVAQERDAKVIQLADSPDSVEEQNVPDNGQLFHVENGSKPSNTADQQVVAVKEELESSGMLCQETTQTPLHNANAAPGATHQSVTVAASLSPDDTPWPAPAPTCTAAACDCQVDAMPTSASLLPEHSQVFAQTPLTANLSRQHMSMAPVHGSSTCCGGTAAQVRSCEYTAQPNSLNTSSNPANAGCQPPAKCQRVDQLGHIQSTKLPSAPALHPADVQLLESGFLDSDSDDDDDVVPVQAGNSLQENAMPPGAAAPHQGIPFTGADQPAHAIGQAHLRPETVQSWTPGHGPPASCTPVPQHAAGCDTWDHVSWLMFQHDMRQLSHVCQHSPEHAGADAVCSSLVLVLDDACKHVNGNMIAWCREQLHRGVLPLGVAMIVRHADGASHCNEIWRDLDSVLSSAEFIGSAAGTVTWLGTVQLPQALGMLLDSYKRFQQHCC